MGHVTTVTVHVHEVEDQQVVCELCQKPYTRYIRAVAEVQGEYSPGLISKLLNSRALTMHRVQSKALEAAVEQMSRASAFPHRCTHCGQIGPADLKQLTASCKARTFTEPNADRTLFSLRDWDLKRYQSELALANEPEVVALWKAYWQCRGIRAVERVKSADEKWAKTKVAWPGAYADLEKALHAFDPWWPWPRQVVAGAICPTLRAPRRAFRRQWINRYLIALGISSVGVFFLALLIAAITNSDNSSSAPMMATMLTLWILALIPIAILLYRREPLRRILARTLALMLMPFAAQAQTPTSDPGRGVSEAKPHTVAQSKIEPPCSDAVWTNTLGMPFVPVADTAVLFAQWETRVQDFEQFVKETGHDATAGMSSLKGGKWGPHGDTWRNPGFAQGPTHPVVGVSWDDAQAFCRWLTEKEHRAGRLQSNQRYRLPSDLEWSRAVGLAGEVGSMPRDRSGKIADVYPWGTQWPPPHGAGNFAGSEVKDADWTFSLIENFRDPHSRTAPAGSYVPNRFGLFDLAGNVWEWCEDYGEDRSGARVLRGGSWGSFVAVTLLSSNRTNSKPGIRYDNYGFRCVLASSP